jgi:cullin 4
MLLKPHVNTIVEKGLNSLIDGNRLIDIRRMYLLLDRVNSLDIIKQGWVDYLRQKGEQVVNNKDSATEKTLVDDILQLHDKHNEILKYSFNNNEHFKSSLRTSFEYFLNIMPSKIAELLAKYVDKKLRGERGVTENETERALDRCMTLFRYMHGKDIFEAFYKKSLCKRLLLSKSASNELEKIMISKMKTECGANYTSKLEGMFQDIDLSIEVENGYKKHLLDEENDITNTNIVKTKKQNKIDLQIQVLTVGYWPIDINEGSKVNIPRSIIELRDSFNSYYTNKYSGRRLIWAHTVERCILSAKFPKGKKELEVTLMQAITLLCFNHSETSGSSSSSSSSNKLTLDTIRDQTGIEDGELRRILQSLACGVIGTRVIKKEPKSKDINDNDIFYSNKDFSNDLYRIKINSILLRDTSDDNDRTREEVFRDRQYLVDAVCVRIMKTRKRMNHQSLISELLQQLRWPARPQDLKKRIESLIERDYIERDSDDPSIYNYLA